VLDTLTKGCTAGCLHVVAVKFSKILSYVLLVFFYANPLQQIQYMKFPKTKRMKIEKIEGFSRDSRPCNALKAEKGAARPRTSQLRSSYSFHVTASSLFHSLPARQMIN
jgi:hypothetical protein